LRYFKCDWKSLCFGSAEVRLVLVYKPRFKWLSDGESGDRTPPSFGILIIGGGFSGATLAYQLMRRDPTQNLAIVDPGELLGRGIAYSTPYWSHVLNVPAKNMSAFPDDVGHFVRWARRNFSPNVCEESFLPRAIYGRYLDSLLKEAATRSGRDLPWFRDQVLTLNQTDGLYSVHLKSGRRLLAKAVVIATGNVPPGDPSISGLTDAATKYFPFSWSHTALDRLCDSNAVLLIGAGLTSVDLAIALASTGFHGTIHMLSRRGLLPQPHRHAGTWSPFWNHKSPRTVRGLLRLIRNELRAAAETGADWRSVIDALRPVTPEIWQSLPEGERRRFMRHVRPYWDAHRHRVAPEISERLAYLVQQGRIQLHAGRITNYREEGNHAVVTYRRRRDGLAEEVDVDRVINCTGPEADWRRIDNSLLSSLFAQRLARPDPLFLGLDVDRDGSVRNDLGVASKSLFAIGPVRKGSVWETTAVPELRQQAFSLAEHILRVMNEERSAEKLSAETLNQ
jgi:uncharacterized NAD(P)/FAD-binding protein YdhS